MNLMKDKSMITLYAVILYVMPPVLVFFNELFNILISADAADRSSCENMERRSIAQLYTE